MNSTIASLTLDTSQGSCGIYIENGLFNNIGSLLPKVYTGKSITIITDSNLDQLYGEKLMTILQTEGFELHKLVIKPGEASKSMETLGEVYNMLTDCGVTRDSLIATFGGGVVGDLAGFAAATYMRGIPYIQIPTSLLAQIDSSIGGKVAINLDSGKNLAGSFYHPLAVFIDPELLQTLEDRYLHDGMAEVIKYGAIKDSGLFALLQALPSKKELLENIDKIIYSCCSIKKQTVENDERDRGERLLLNFGHTIGHGLESYFNYEKYSHGEAVAIGMYAITLSSEAMGLTLQGTADSLRSILQKYNLPWALPELDIDSLIKIMKRDKKGSAAHLNIVLLHSIGESFIKSIALDTLHSYIGLNTPTREG